MVCVCLVYAICTICPPWLLWHACITKRAARQLPTYLQIPAIVLCNV